MSHRNVDWDAVASIRSSKSRRLVVESLQDSPKYAQEIADDLDYVNRDTATRQIRWLKKRDLAECLTPDRPHHRIYGLTEEGEAVADEV
jgi:predicted transcriptional regulator